MRVLAVADVYEALTSDRPYRPAMSSAEALEVMRPDVPGRLDRDAFSALEAVLEERRPRRPAADDAFRADAVVGRPAARTTCGVCRPLVRPSTLCGAELPFVYAPPPGSHPGVARHDAEVVMGAESVVDDEPVSPDVLESVDVLEPAAAATCADEAPSAGSLPVAIWM